MDARDLTPNRGPPRPHMYVQPGRWVNTQTGDIGYRSLGEIELDSATVTLCVRVGNSSQIVHSIHSTPPPDSRLDGPNLALKSPEGSKAHGQSVGSRFHVIQECYLCARSFCNPCARLFRIPPSPHSRRGAGGEVSFRGQKTVPVSTLTMRTRSHTMRPGPRWGRR